MSKGRLGDARRGLLTGVADAAAVDGEVDAGLEDRLAARPAVDPDPCGRRVPPGPPRRFLRVRDDEGARHGLVGGLIVGTKRSTETGQSRLLCG